MKTRIKFPPIRLSKATEEILELARQLPVIEQHKLMVMLDRDRKLSAKPTAPEKNGTGGSDAP
jgi:hypothetical protein